MNCPQCSTLLTPGQTACPSCGLLVQLPQSHPPLVPVGGLGIAVAVLMAVTGACNLIVSQPHAEIFGLLGLVGFLTFIALIPTFIIWLFLVRRNAGRWGPQRRRSGWAIAGWFVPPVLLWFPYQIADDAWKASRPPSGGALRSRAIVIGWWLCWLVAWISGYWQRDAVRIGTRGATDMTEFGFALGSTVVSGIFSAAAAVFGVTMVLTMSRWQRQRIEEGRSPNAFIPQG
jgi:hypothetical protein